MEKLFKPNNRKTDIDRSSYGALVWTKEKKKEFNKYLKENGIEETAKFYNLKKETVVRYEDQFKSNKE
jgi:hypothetical protein